MSTKLVPALLAGGLAASVLAHEPLTPNYASNEVTPINEQDKAVYQTVGGMGCAVCHGEYGDGGESVGNNIRDSSLERLKHAFETVPVMQGLARAMDDDKYAAIDRYLSQLAERQLLKVVVNGQTMARASSETLDQSVYGQLVIHNGGSQIANIVVNGTLQTIAPRANFAMDIEPGEASIQLQHAEHVLLIERQ